MESPIPLASLEAATDPNNPTFFPPEAYTSPAFYEFELEAVWRHEWVMAGRLEEIPEPGDYFSVEIAGEPLLISRADDGGVTAVSAVCRHRGMLIAEGRGRCERAFICPYHSWAYSPSGDLVGAPQQPDLVGTGITLPRVQAEVWKGFIFVNLDPGAQPLAQRLEPLEEIVAPYRLEDLRGEFLRDADYQFEFDYPWNWKVYADGQNECYHCDKLHGDTPLMQLTDCNSMTFGVMEPDFGVFHFTLQNRDIDVTLNHTGRAIFGPIPTLSEDQRRRTETITIAPSVLLVLQSDSVIVLGYTPTGPTSMRVKRHRLYPQQTLDRSDFAERHRDETAAIRTFVGQDDFAFARVQRGLESQFAPRGPILPRERILIGTSRWLLDRYRTRGASSVPQPA